MNYEQFVSVGRDTIQSILFTTSPILLATLLVGLIIGIFQAATSINEATLTFVPKLLVIVIVLIHNIKKQTHTHQCALHKNLCLF